MSELKQNYEVSKTVQSMFFIYCIQTFQVADLKKQQQKTT